MPNTNREGRSAGSYREERRMRRRFRVRYGTSSIDQEAWTQNLSASGVYLKTTEVFETGTPVNLEIKTDKGTYRVHGTVAWAKKVPTQLAHLLDPGMGIQLVDPPAEWIEFCSQWT